MRWKMHVVSPREYRTLTHQNMYIRKRRGKRYELYWLWLILDTLFNYAPKFPGIKMYSVSYSTLRDGIFVVVDLWVLRRALRMAQLHFPQMQFVSCAVFCRCEPVSLLLSCSCFARSNSIERQVAGMRQNGHCPCIENRTFQHTQSP